MAVCIRVCLVSFIESTYTIFDYLCHHLRLPLAFTTIVYFINHRYDGAQLWDLRLMPGMHDFVWWTSLVSFLFLYPSTFNLLEIAVLLVHSPLSHLTNDPRLWINLSFIFGRQVSLASLGILRWWVNFSGALPIRPTSELPSCAQLLRCSALITSSLSGMEIED